MSKDGGQAIEDQVFELVKASSETVSITSLRVVDLVEKLAQLSHVIGKLTDSLSSLYYANLNLKNSKCNL